MDDNYIDFEFHYASFNLEPLAKDNSTSSQLLKNIIQSLNSEDFPSESKIIDRHKERKNTPSRNLVIISNRFERKGLRCFGKIALIKNKAPKIWGGKDIIEEISKEKNKRFIEVTNYIINFNESSKPVIMHEFNHEGPRLSDIEYYYRQISKKLHLARSINSSLHLESDYNQLDKEMSNIFEVVVKVNAANANKLNWHNELKQLKDATGFKDVRLEFFYKRKKEKNGKYEKNIMGLDFARKMIAWLKKNAFNIEYLEDLKMSYQVGEDDNVIDLDFLKNKTRSLIRIETFDGLYESKELMRLAANEFNYYLTNGKTNNEIP
jgi:hypothetical protein